MLIFWVAVWFEGSAGRRCRYCGRQSWVSGVRHGQGSFIFVREVETMRFGFGLDVRMCRLVFNDRLETVVRVRGVFDDSLATVRLYEAVTSSNAVPDALFALTLVVSGLRAVDIVLVAVLGQLVL